MSTDKKKPKRHSVKKKELKQGKSKPTRVKRKISKKETEKEARVVKKKKVHLKLNSPVFASVKTKLHGMNKIRIGRGFSLSEIAKVGLDAPKARKLGLYVDSLRKSLHEENVKLLKDALSNIAS